MYFVLYFLRTSPHMNIYYLMMQKHTSPTGLLLLSNPPPQKRSPLVESESKQTLGVCQTSSEEKPDALSARSLLYWLQRLLCLLLFVCCYSVYTAKTLQLVHNRCWLILIYAGIDQLLSKAKIVSITESSIHAHYSIISIYIFVLFYPWDI